MCDFRPSYTFDLAHRKSKESVVADAQSRLPLPPTVDDQDQCRLIEDGDLEVYMIDSSSCKPRKSLPLQTFVRRPKQVCYYVQLAMPPNADEVAEATWNELQDSLSSRTAPLVGRIFHARQPSQPVWCCIPLSLPGRGG